MKATRPKPPKHIRLYKYIIDDVNPRLAPGVQASDVSMPPTVEPPYYEEHDYSSDLGEGENRREILDLYEFANLPTIKDLLTGPDGLRYKALIMSEAKKVRRRNRQRRMQRL